MTATTFACEKPTVLVDAMQALAKGETSEYAKIVDDYPKCIRASDFPKQQWTVMRVEGSIVSIGVPKVQQWEAFCPIDDKLSNDFSGYHRCPTDPEWWIPASWVRVSKAT